MVKRRYTGRSHSREYFSVRNHRFWKIYKLQSFITTEVFRFHCAHIVSPFSMSLLTCAARPQPRRLLMSIETTSRSRIGLSPWSFVEHLWIIVIILTTGLDS